jgi:hypothetical protein
MSAFQFTHPLKPWVAPVKACPKVHFVQKESAGKVDYN